MQDTHQKNRLQKLTAAFLAINSGLTLDEMPRIIAEQARQVIEAQRASVTLMPDKDPTRTLHASSMSDSCQKCGSLLNDSYLQTLIQQPQVPICMARPELAAQLPSANGSLPDELLAIGLIGQDSQLIGFIQLADKYGGAFDEEDELILQQLGQMASVALENARLYRECLDAKQSKAESLALLDTFLNTAPIGFALLDNDLHYVRINNPMATLSGITPEAHIGRTVSEIVPEWASSIETMARHVLDTGKPLIDVERSNEASVPDDHRHWLCTYYPVNAPNGRKLGVGVVVVDITERKHNEEELHHREQEFRAIVENAPSIIARFDKSLRHSYVNPAVMRMTGLMPESYIGKTYQDLGFPEELCMLFQSHLQEVFLTGQRQAVEFDFTTPTGLRIFETRMAPELAKDGSVEYVLTITFDVTESKRAEELLRRANELLEFRVAERTAELRVTNERLQIELMERKRTEDVLRESEERYRTLVETSPDAIIFIDLSDIILLCNQQTAALLGYENTDRLISRNLLEFIAPEEHPRMAQNLRRMREMGSLRGIEYTLLDKDGNRCPTDLSGSLIKDSYGKHRGFIIVLRDVTERKRAALLLETERRHVAYELHDGLAQVAASLHQHLQAFAAHYHPRSQEKRQELIQVLELAHRVVGETRRVIAGLRPTALDEFGLATALRLQLEAYRSNGWDITYYETLGADRLPAAIETALFWVAQEALTNVRKHAQTLHVRLSLHRQDDLVKLTIQDWGCGFDPSRLSQSAGLGEHLGLLGMQERVALLGGRCYIASQPGVGTQVMAEVTIPTGGDT